MPRKSAAALAVVPIEEHKPQRIEPPSGISAQEAALFREIVESAPALQFVQSDSRLVLAYVQCCLLAKATYRRAALEDGELGLDERALALWERVTKVQSSLAHRLRLCPSARVDPKTLTRAHLGREFVYHGGASRETLDLVANGKSAARGWLPRRGDWE
jgi:hypothetical protein